MARFKPSKRYPPVTPESWTKGNLMQFTRPPGDSSRDLFGMVSSRDPFKGLLLTSNVWGIKRSRLESPGLYNLGLGIIYSKEIYWRTGDDSKYHKLPYHYITLEAKWPLLLFGLWPFFEGFRFHDWILWWLLWRLILVWNGNLSQLGEHGSTSDITHLPSLKLTFSHLKMDGWNTNFLLGCPFLRGVKG